MKAYWFEPAYGKLGYGDGRIPKPGVTHTVDCKPVLYVSGLNGSRHVFDALQYAGSNICWRVEITGNVQVGDVEIYGERRTYLQRVDLTDVLRVFACQCALDVAHLWDAPDHVVSYLEDPLNATEKQRAAAWSAAFAKFHEGFEGGAVCAALQASLSDPSNAWSGAWNAAFDASWSAAPAKTDLRSRCRARLSRMVNKAFKDAGQQEKADD